jgi:WD40 repeat protein
LVSAGGNNEDFDIRVWDVGSGKLLQTLDKHTDIVWSVAFSPDGQMLASVSKDGTGKIWDWRTGSLVKSFNFPNQVTSVTFSPDGQTLAIGGVKEWPDAAIWTFSVPSWQPEMELSEYWNIPAIVYSPDGKYLVGGGTSRNSRIWGTSDGVDLFILYHSGQVFSLAMSPDGSTVASGLVGAVWIWDVDTGTLIQKLSDFSGWVESVAYSVDGSLLIARSDNGRLYFYDTSDFQTILYTTPQGGGLFTLSPGGRLLATARRDGLIDLWRVDP